MDTGVRNTYWGIAIAFFLLSLLLVSTGSITYQGALIAVPCWGGVLFGIYQYRSRKEEEADNKVVQRMMRARISRLYETNEKLTEQNWKLKTKKNDLQVD